MPMDVLHFTHQFAPETRGGIESYLRDLIGAQREAGMRVQVLTGSQRQWETVGCEHDQVDGVPVVRLHRDDRFFDLYSKAWHPEVEALLRQLLRDARPKVVHIHQWIRLTSNLVEIVRSEGIPVVVTLHDFYLSCPRAFRLARNGDACRQPLSPAACRDCAPRYGYESAREVDRSIELFAQQSRAELLQADAVLVAATSTAELMASTLELPRELFAVLPLGYRRRFPGLPQLAPPERGPLRFAFWGGVAPHKGLRPLLAAMLLLAREPLPRAIELHVLGGFATEAFANELRAAAANLPVTFHGPFATADLRTLGAAVGVFPSTCLETFGIVLDECLELGLPCIVSDRGALADRVGGGGLVTVAGDATSLAQAMRRFVTEPELWLQLRQHLPALPPDLSQHVTELNHIYAAARQARRSANAPPGVSMAERAAFLRLQRESAQRGLPANDDR